MRYLIDTNIFLYLSLDADSLNPDVAFILQEPENLIFISAESVRELIIAYKKKGLGLKRWKSAEEMVNSIEDEFFIRILPLKKEDMLTYSRLEINEAQDHKDPSDHVIISQAMTQRMPLISSDRKFKFYTRQGLNLVFNEK